MKTVLSVVGYGFLALLGLGFAGWWLADLLRERRNEFLKDRNDRIIRERETRRDHS